MGCTFDVIDSIWRRFIVEQQLVIVNYACGFNQSETGKYFERIIKTIIGWGLCDIQNNQGRGRSYQPQPLASVDNPYLALDYSEYHKKPNLIVIVLSYIEQKNGSRAIASSLMGNNTKQLNLT